MCAVSGVTTRTISIKYIEDGVDDDRVQGHIQTNVRRTPKLI